VIQRPHVAGHGTDWRLLDQLVPFTLSDPMVLAGTVALMELVQNMGRTNASGMSKSVMRNATNAINQIQQKLTSSTETMGDNVVLAILNLAAMEFHEHRYNGRGRLDIHMRALLRIVELRGGVDNLGFDGYLKYTVLAYKALWEQMKSTPESRPPKVIVKYPTHPFSPELCAQISQLPSGFEECILQGQLCTAVIDMIHELHSSRVDGQIPFPILKDTSTQAIYVTWAEGLSLFESVIVLGIIMFVIHTDATKTMYRLLKPFSQVRCQALLSSGKDLSAQNRYQREPLIWASCLFLATTQWGSWTSRLGKQVMEKVAKRETWEEKIKICEGMLWGEEWSDELRLKIQDQFGAASIPAVRTQAWLERIQT
jgi:hypothetical protein